MSDFKREGGRSGPLVAETPLGVVKITSTGKGKKRFEVTLEGATIAHAPTQEKAKAAAVDIVARRTAAANERPKGWGRVKVKETPDTRKGATGLVYVPDTFEGRDISGRFQVRKNLTEKKGWELVEGSQVLGAFGSVNEALAEVAAIVVDEPAPAPVESAEKPSESKPRRQSSRSRSRRAAEKPEQPQAEPEPQTEPEVEAPEAPVVAEDGEDEGARPDDEPEVGASEGEGEAVAQVA